MSFNPEMSAKSNRGSMAASSIFNGSQKDLGHKIRRNMLKSSIDFQQKEKSSLLPVGQKRNQSPQAQTVDVVEKKSSILKLEPT